ncbi:hypothetical protein Agub_g7909 [Astrephomene gubernaculifera]|uniref:Uncharacterized protein n=1 Tax=Astrephomene gubernaculifera TaxID=47775 RepID=A0AAD3HMP7_9CHLO|nr:hypothetical protein Agub_g7909 [Astrephomene gubernaculifera]
MITAATSCALRFRGYQPRREVGQRLPNATAWSRVGASSSSSSNTSATGSRSYCYCAANENSSIGRTWSSSSCYRSSSDYPINRKFIVTQRHVSCFCTTRTSDSSVAAAMSPMTAPMSSGSVVRPDCCTTMVDGTAAAAGADLWREVVAVYDRAQASGACSKTETKAEMFHDSQLGVDFVLRVATALKAKPQGPPTQGSPSKVPGEQSGKGPQPAASPKPAWRNPFLPPEPELFVRHLGPYGQQYDMDSPPVRHVGHRYDPQGDPPQLTAVPAVQPSPPQHQHQQQEQQQQQQQLLQESEPEHSLVLNKFNVVRHHVLVITRQFRSQAEPLYGGDLAAAMEVLQAMPRGGVAFYNCGPHSGRSQPHKHMQVVPLPFLEEEEEGQRQGEGQGAQQQQQHAGGERSAEAPVHRLVMQAAAEAAAAGGGAAALQPFALRQVPYECYAALLPESPTPDQLESTFNSLLQLCHPGYSYNANSNSGSNGSGGAGGSSSNISGASAANGSGDASGSRSNISGADGAIAATATTTAPQDVSYNVLLTRSWMMLVPRRAERCGPLALNSLAFAGTILVRSEDELDFVRQSGPAWILSQVGVPW